MVLLELVVYKIKNKPVTYPKGKVHTAPLQRHYSATTALQNTTAHYSLTPSQHHYTTTTHYTITPPQHTTTHYTITPPQHTIPLHHHSTLYHYTTTTHYTITPPQHTIPLHHHSTLQHTIPLHHHYSKLQQNN